MSSSDPFGEHEGPRLRRDLHVLGGDFRFETNSRQLLRLVEQAFAGLPRYRLTTPSPRFSVCLTVRERISQRRTVPPPPRLSSGAGYLNGNVDADNFVTVSPAAHNARIAVSSDMLRYPHLVRYELIEFAVLTLAARSQGLVALHAACVGDRRRGVLLVGDSGAGKTTVALESQLAGLDYLSEDSVFVTPDCLRAVATPNFLHLRVGSVRRPKAQLRAALRAAVPIRRRSGERKFAIDLRRHGFRIAPRPLPLAAIVFLSKRSASGDRMLRPVVKGRVGDRLRKLQPYAAAQPEWRRFSRSVARLPAFELGRGKTPAEAASALRALLAGLTG